MIGWDGRVTACQPRMSAMTCMQLATNGPRDSMGSDSIHRARASEHEGGEADKLAVHPETEKETGPWEHNNNAPMHQPLSGGSRGPERQY